MNLFRALALCLSLTLISVESYAVGCIGDWPDQICAEPQPPVRKPVSEEAYLVARFVSASHGNFSRTFRQASSLRSLVGATQICYGGRVEDVVTLLSDMSRTASNGKLGYFSSFSAFVQNGYINLTAATSVQPAFAMAYVISSCR